MIETIHITLCGQNYIMSAEDIESAIKTLRNARHKLATKTDPTQRPTSRTIPEGKDYMVENFPNDGAWIVTQELSDGKLIVSERTSEQETISILIINDVRAEMGLYHVLKERQSKRLKAGT
jgi:hypothetical protein